MRLGPTRRPKTAATAPLSPFSRWPISTARLMIFTPGMIRANARALENSVSSSQPRLSTSAVCIHTDTPPPKLESPILENRRKSSAKPALNGGRGSVASTAEVFISFQFAMVRTLLAFQRSALIAHRKGHQKRVWSINILPAQHPTKQAPAAFVPDLKGRHAVDLLTIPACLICTFTF